jgi:RNA polymerase sigma factor (sigma-70 family)
LIQSDLDTTLWQSFRKGHAQALELLYNRHFKALASYGYRITSDHQLVEDAIQDVFVDLWRRKEYLGTVDNVRFYLFKALRNQLYRNSRNDVFEGAQHIDEFLDYLSTLSSEQQSIRHETLQVRTQVIQNALNRLSPRQREAIHLRFYQGMSLDDSAELMGVPKQVVKNLLSKSYAILRLSLKIVYTSLGWLVLRS